MTVLTNDQRKNVVEGWVKENFVKPNAVANQHGGDILAAVAAFDDWIEANQASANTALPEPFRSTATAKQKSSLFAEVLAERWNVG